jgi:hypothetical protein
MRENRGKMKRFRLSRAVVGVALLALAFAVPAVVHAVCSPDAQSCSNSYQVNETFFGSGGDLSNCSFAYCAKTSVGELGVGNSKGTLYQSQSGFNTDRAPYLEFKVTSSSVDLGVLSVGSASYTNATFSVKTYLAGGYILQTVSDPPTGSAPGFHQLAPMTSGDISRPGTEQFGMNLVANTSPATFGQAPQQIPDSTFSFGNFATGYGTANTYKYNKNDTIAQSTKSTGETDFTASYIFNISNVTPASEYTFHQILVATSTF